MLVPIFQLEKIENSICLFAQVVNHKSQPVGENRLVRTSWRCATVLKSVRTGVQKNLIPCPNCPPIKDLYQTLVWIRCDIRFWWVSEISIPAQHWC